MIMLLIIFFLVDGFDCKKTIEFEQLKSFPMFSESGVNQDFLAK